MQSHYIRLRKTRDFGETISDTIQYIKQHWKQLILRYFIFVVPIILLATLLGVDSIGAFLRKMSNPDAFMENPLSFFTASLGIAIVLYLLSGVAYGTVVYLYMAQTEERGGMAPSLSESGARFFPAFLTNAAYLLLIVVGFLGFALFIIVPIIGILIYITAFLYCIVSLALVYPINTVENRPFPAAFQRMFYLIRNRWWYSFGVIIVFGLIYYFFASVIGFAVNTIMGFSAINFMKPESMETIASKKYLLTLGISSIFQQMFFIILQVGIGVHYFSLREEKDGSGLEEQLDQLGNNAGPHGHIEEQY